jgi:hypothetical protein
MKRLGIAAFAALAITAATAAPSGAADTTQKCVSDQQYINDGGSKYCVDTDGSCLVYEYRSSIFGTEYYCHVRRP